MKKRYILGIFVLVAIFGGLKFGPSASAQKAEVADETFVADGAGKADTDAPETVVFTEDFSYSAGALLTANGWASHSGAGISPIAAVSPGLTYSGYVGSGVGNASGIIATGEDVSRTFAVQTSGSVYTAFLVNLTDATVDPLGGYFFHIGPDPISTTFRGRVFAKKDGANAVAFGISKGGNAAAGDIAFTPHSFALNTTYLLVVKYTIVAGATNDTIGLIVNPTLGGAEPAVNVTAPDVGATDVDPGSVAIRQGEATRGPLGSVDGIRVATAWADLSGGGAGTPAGPKLFKANLSGAQEVPPVTTNAFGTGRVSLNAAETQITASVYFNNLSSNASNGHIHGPAAVGANGPVIFNMAPPAQTTGSSVNVTFAVTPAQVTQLKAGLWYFNIHTGTNPGGEIRGQILVNTPRFDTDGDGDSDYGIVRPGAGGAGGVTTWFTTLNVGTANDPFTINQFGTNSDVITPGDFDGDRKDDIAFWRPTATPTFFILRSSDSTVQQVIFGLQGDVPIVGDYSGDGRDDPSIYRAGATASSQSFFWSLHSSGPLSGVQVVYSWGLGSDFAAPGDYDGDGRHDLCVVRNIGGANTFILFSSQSQVSYTTFGLAGIAPDRIAPGDYNGDGITDFAVTRNEGGAIVWYYRPSGGGADVRVPWGVAGSDIESQGDYDGNGTTDPAIWRTAGGSTFFALTSPTTVRFQRWGLPTDLPSIYDLHGE